MMSFDDPTSHFTRNMVEYAKRHAKPRRLPKEPLTPHMLRSMYHVIGGEEATLLDLRKFCILLLSYTGFLRFDEVSQLTRGDVRFFNTHMLIFLERSKTDIYRDGHTLVTSRLNSPCCPVRILLSYIEHAKIMTDELYLFRAVTWWKKRGVYTMRVANHPLSYSTCRVDALDLVARVGFDPRSFGLHSARSGGATEAANRGVPDRLFKRHGRWASDRAKDSYVKDNLDHLLRVSRSLGL